MSLRYIGGLVSPSVNPLAANVTTSPNVAQYNGSFTLQQQAQALTSNQWATDPYYKNTTLLLHADGKANGSQNNTFLDSSASPLTITRNGNTTQGSFTPYGSTWSNYFDGSSYLAPSSNAVGATGTFTIECWVYISSTTTNQCVYSQYLGADAGRWQIFYNASKTNGFSFEVGASTAYLSTNTYAINTWHHIAWVRDSSNNLSFYINGVRDATTASVSTSLSVQNPFIANRYGGAVPYYGYISNLRITNTAVYSGTTYTLPTAPLTAITGTILLTCQSNRFVDNSASPLTFTIGGTPSVQRFSPFAPQYQYTPAVIGGSAYFDGTGDYLTAPNNTAVQLGSSDFTVESWIYTTAAATTQTICGKETAGTDSFLLHINNSSGNKAAFNLSSDGSSYSLTLTGTTTLAANSWNHIAAVRSGSGSNNIKLYVNGVQEAQGTFSGTIYNDTSSVAIGYRQPASNLYFYGYISDTRITKSGALYTTTFTPPTAPLTTTVSSGTVSLLTNMTNAGITDNAMMNNLETVGNAQVSTSVVKYGSGSLYFDGSGDYAITYNSNLYLFGTGDFTAETWIYPNSFSAEAAIISTATSTDYQGFTLNVGTSGNIIIALGSGGSWTVVASSGAGTLSTNQWQHLALTRFGNVFKIFINGIQTWTTTNSLSLTNTNNAIAVGGRSAGGGQYLNGYLDDFRITKGVARYTSNFIPPKVAFSNQ